MRWIASMSMTSLCVLVLLGGCKSGDDDGGSMDGDGRTVEGPEQAGASAGGGKGGTPGGQSGESGSAGNAGEGGSSSGDRDGGPSAGNGGSSGGDSRPHDGGVVIDPTALPETPLSELPDVFASAICDALYDCLGASKLRELTRREDCDATVAGELRAKDFALMDDSVAAGRVLYDPEMLPECVEGIVALGCGVLNHTFPDACVEVLDGNVEINGECVITADCEGAAYCAGAESCPSTCEKLLTEGVGCSADDQCADGLSCLGGECAKPSGHGDDCGGTSGKSCALGLNCMGATDTAIGSCVRNDEVQVGDDGDACEPGGALCKDGLSCVYDGTSAFRCEAAVASGAACHLGLPGQCPNDEYCDSTEVTAASTCRKLPGDGEQCVLNGLCRGGTVCVTSGDDDRGTCRGFADNGEECVADGVCRSGRCEQGVCEPPPACE